MAINISGLPTASLQPGQRSAEVKQLQTWLINNGFSIPDGATGFYGDQTKAAVTRLQSQLGVNTAGNDGYFGPRTISAVQSSSATASRNLNFSQPSSTNSTVVAPPSSGYTAPVTQSAAPLLSASAQSSSSSSAASNNPIASLPSLGPGSSGPDVKTLQDWLVQNGYMTAAQMATGPGTYGPQTMAAVAAWQRASGIDTQGNPGYFGPISKAYIANSAASGTGTGNGGAGNGTPADQPITGNANLDQILKSVQGLIDTNKAVIPAGMQITPALVGQFLSWAHQAVDPQTKQLIDSEITNVNSNLSNLATQYENSKADITQTFGTNLATEQNAAGGSGTAFSGLRNLTERNMAASTNRTLASLGSDAAYNIGGAMRTAAANVGSSNAGGINAPSLIGGQVSFEGGSRGSFSPSNTLDFKYNPSLYTAGVIPTNQNTAVNNLQGNYISQYGTLAGNQSGRSMKDLISQITGLPSGYQIPSNLT